MSGLTIGKTHDIIGTTERRTQMKMNELVVGGYILNGDGIYKVLEVRERKAYVCEVEFDDEGHDTIVSEAFVKNVSEIAKCQRL